MLNSEKRQEDETPSAPVSEFSIQDSALSPGIPFAHVAINPTILDGKGERMSKSKGNGVDPVDIIHSHGADAMRFTLATMATETQDVRMPVTKLPDGRNTSERFDAGRNLCNKLWNAARFILGNLQLANVDLQSEDGGQRPASSQSQIANRHSQISSLPDRWLLSRLATTVKEANDALTHYRFDQYAKACYDFFWRDLCDWYVEASKPAMKDPARAGQTADVLAVALDVSLRLMHPMIPYITEALWEKLNEVRPLESRSIPGKLDPQNAAGFSAGSPRSARLIHANWPLFDDELATLVSDDAEHVFPRLQAIVGAIRNLRNEHKVDPRKTVTVTISAPGDEAVAVTSDNREMIEVLAVCTIKTVAANLPQPAGTMHVVVHGNCDVYVEGLVDIEAQAQLTEKKRADLTKQIATLKGRMANESYMAKAPPKLVEQTKQQLADAEAELAKLG
jgi:valyl-tRNA synthetase